MTILRVYRIGERSWVSPSALLSVIRSDVKVKVVKHHPDANAEYAIGHALRELVHKFVQIRVQAIAVLLWSLVPALLILWPPVFYAMSSEARGAVWIGSGACILIAMVAFGRAVMMTRTVTKPFERWDVEDGPTLLPPVVAWREE